MRESGGSCALRVNLYIVLRGIVWQVRKLFQMQKRQQENL